MSKYEVNFMKNKKDFKKSEFIIEDNKYIYIKASLETIWEEELVEIEKYKNTDYIDFYIDQILSYIDKKGIKKVNYLLTGSKSFQVINKERFIVEIPNRLRTIIWD